MARHSAPQKEVQEDFHGENISGNRHGDDGVKLISRSQLPERFRKAVERLSREAANLRLEQAALDAYLEVRPVKNRFLAVACGALLGDELIRLIRIFDNSKKVVSFWYLLRCDPRIENKIDIERLRDFSSKIERVRNATFVHIDKRTVFDPKKIYREVGLTRSEIVFAMETVWQVASDLWIEQFRPSSGFS